MKHLRLQHRSWILALVGALIAGHAVVLYCFLSRMTWTVALGVLILLLLLNHVGLVGAIYARFRRRSRCQP